MSNAIQFLESLGRRPAPATASFADYEEIVQGICVPDHQRAALLALDPVALGSALDGRIQMVCAVCTPDDDDGQHEAVPDDGDKDDDMVPDDEESPKHG